MDMPNIDEVDVENSSSDDIGHAVAFRDPARKISNLSLPSTADDGPPKCAGKPSLAPVYGKSKSVADGTPLRQHNEERSAGIDSGVWDLNGNSVLQNEKSALRPLCLHRLCSPKRHLDVLTCEDTTEPPPVVVPENRSLRPWVVEEQNANWYNRCSSAEVSGGDAMRDQHCYCLDSLDSRTISSSWPDFRVDSCTSSISPNDDSHKKAGWETSHCVVRNSARSRSSCDISCDCSDSTDSNSSSDEYGCDTKDCESVQIPSTVVHLTSAYNLILRWPGRLLEDRVRHRRNCSENRKSRSLPSHYRQRYAINDNDSTASSPREECVSPEPQTPVVSNHVRSSTRSSVKKVNPTEFKTRLDVMKMWFSQFDDEQKNLVLKALLDDCGPSQNHVLSVAMDTKSHQSCPPNCQDLLSWLPTHLALYIFSFLDAVSVARCSRVCRSWYTLASEPCLWQQFCKDPKWQLSQAGEQKQQALHEGSHKTMNWKKDFIERYRLRRNWLKGICHVRTFEGHTQGISCVQFDETRIVSGSSDKTIKVWNIRTNSPWSVMTLVGHSGTVRCLHLEGNRLVSGSTDRTIKVWDLSTQHDWSSIACKVTMIGHLDTVRCLQVDDRKIVSGSYDKTLKVWDIRTGECQLTLRGHEAAVLCLQFDGTKIVSGSCDKTIKIWHLSNGVCVATLHGHHDAVTCLQFDESRILSGSLDRTIKFWSLETRQCVRTLDWMKSEGHTGVIRCLQADSWRFVSGGDDKTLKVWSLETGQRLVTLRNHSDGVTCLQFNDSIIVSGSYDKTVKLWDFSVC